MNAPAGTQTLGVPRLGHQRTRARASATLHYSDGSTAQYWLGLSDWTLNGGGRSRRTATRSAATTAYRNCAGCSAASDTVDTNVFYAAVPVDPAKTLTSVTLPDRRHAGRAAHLLDRHLDHGLDRRRWSPR